jgi:hypothetical protein
VTTLVNELSKELEIAQSEKVVPSAVWPRHAHSDGLKHNIISNTGTFEIMKAMTTLNRAVVVVSVMLNSVRVAIPALNHPTSRDIQAIIPALHRVAGHRNTSILEIELKP